MNKIIGLVLLLAGAFSVYHGIQLYQDATASVSVLGLDISAKDQETTQQAYLFMGLGALAAVIGWLSLRR